MGESREPRRIEIDLTSLEDQPASASIHGNDSDRGTPVISGRPVADERRPYVVAALVGIIALAVGWMLGRAGSTSEPIAAVVETTAVRNAIEPIESVQTPDRTSPVSGDVSGAVSERSDVVVADSTGQDGSTESPGQAESPTVEIVELPGVLAGQQLEIVAFGNGSRLQRLDLSTGEFTTREVERQPFGRPRLVVGDDWVMLPPVDPSVSTFVVTDGGGVTQFNFGVDRQVVGTTDRASVWVMTRELVEGAAGTAQRVALSGTSLERIELPGFPSRFDPRGGFVVDAPGGAYRVDVDLIEQITDGELIALGRDLAVAEECDEQLACTVVVIDRATAARRPLDLRRPLGDTGLRSVGIIGSESVSPDGTVAMVHVLNPVDGSSGQPTIGIIDLATGAVTELGPAQDIDQAVWTPDSAFVLYNRGGKLVAFERGSGVEVVVAAELIAIDAFGVRPIGTDDTPSG